MTDELPDGAEPPFDFERPKFDSSGVVERARAGVPLAVLALLIPVATGTAWIFGWGRGQMWELSILTVAVTAILVTWDAVRIGPRDRGGLEREPAGLLFVGMITFWMFVYPIAYFRRAHFGGPNLGPLSIASVVVFLGAPMASMWSTMAGHPPACSSPEVTAKVQEMARHFYGGDLKSITEFTEESYDKAAHIRRGICTAETDTGPEELDFQVEKPPGSGLQFFVRMPPPRYSPRCTSPAVVTLLNQLAVQLAGPGSTIETPRQVDSDKRNHRRQGECLVRNGDGARLFRFVVESRERPGEERDFQVFLIPTELPSLSDPLVIKQLETILRASGWGEQLESISDITEERFDPETNQRFGRALATLRTEKIHVGMGVSWQDASKGLFQVRAWPLELPSCRNPQVVKMLELRLRQRDPARTVERVDGVEEISYDREKERREGRCVVHDGTKSETVRFRVQWLDRQNLLYAVLLEGDIPPDATL